MKIALAGAESNEALSVLKQVLPPSILVTNMYMSKKSMEKQEEILKAYRDMGCWIIVDSGAFTFLRKYGVLRKDMSIEDFRNNYNLHRDKFEAWQLDEQESRQRFEDEFGKYYNKWKSLLPMYYEYADMIAEIDLDTLLGIDRMKQLREEYATYHDKICYTPHIGFNKEARFQTVEEREYVNGLLATNPRFMGIGSINSKITEALFLEYLPIFKEKKIKVHGWAQTDWESIQHLPYFSIDSSTWLSATKFGVTFEYKNGWTRMKSHDHTQKDLFRRSCETECAEEQINFEAFTKDESFSVLKWSAVQWVRMANYYENDFSKAYWLENDEVVSVIEQKRKEKGINEVIVRPTEEVSVFNDKRLKINRLCNICEISTQCPYFKAGNTCIFSSSGMANNLTSKDLMKSIIDLQMGRVSQAVFAERLKGGSVDGNVTKEMQVLSRMIKEYDFMNQDGTGIHISAKGEGSVGVLERLFGAKQEETKKTEIMQAEDAEIIDE